MKTYLSDSYIFGIVLNTLGAKKGNTAPIFNQGAHILIWGRQPT